jgi:hypothetical protein
VTKPIAALTWLRHNLVMHEFWKKKNFPVFFALSAVAFVFFLKLVGLGWSEAAQIGFTTVVLLLVFVFMGQKMGYFIGERNNPFAAKWVGIVGWALFMVWVAHFFVRL